MSARRFLVAASLFIILLGAPRGDAQNLVQNPRFDTNVTGWTVNPGASAVFSTKDVADATTSGSALVTNSHASAGIATGIAQCIAVTPGNVVDFGGFVFIPPGQTSSFSAFVRVTFTTDAACGSGFSASNDTASATAANQWTPLLSTGLTVPAGAIRALVALRVSKIGAGGTAAAHFDNVVFQVAQSATTTVVASASIHGQNNTFFHSDLWATNQSFAGTALVRARYRCFPGQTCSAAEKTLTIGPRATTFLPDVVAAFFNAPETAGAIELTTDTLTPIVVNTRVYTPSLPNPTYGTPVPGVPSSAARVQTVFNGLGSNGGNLTAGFRSNAGAYNPNSSSTDVIFALYDGGGTFLGSTKRTPAAHEAFQVNDIFKEIGVPSLVTQNATLVVLSGLPVFSQVTLIDNKSGDSVYVPGAADPDFNEGP